MVFKTPYFENEHSGPHLLCTCLNTGTKLEVHGNSSTATPIAPERHQMQCSSFLNSSQGADYKNTCFRK